MFFETFLLPIIVGGSAGFISHLVTNNKSILFPRKEKTKWYWGFLADIAIGSAAAVFAVTYLVPDLESIRNIVGVSILAGMSGESVLLRRTLANEQVKNQNINDINKRLKGEIDNNEE